MPETYCKPDKMPKPWIKDIETQIIKNTNTQFEDTHSEYKIINVAVSREKNSIGTATTYSTDEITLLKFPGWTNLQSVIEIAMLNIIEEIAQHIDKYIINIQTPNNMNNLSDYSKINVAIDIVRKKLLDNKGKILINYTQNLQIK